MLRYAALAATQLCGVLYAIYRLRRRTSDGIAVTASASARPAANRPAAYTAPPPTTGGLRVLLAEDNLINQKVTRIAIEKMGHVVVVASNGAEAVQAHAARRFDLVLMDLQMPDMDGFAATAEIRQTEDGAGSRVPIVALTAHAMKGDRERCLAAGMDGYISKPIDLKALRRLIDGIAQSASEVPGKWSTMEGNETCRSPAVHGRFVRSELGSADQ